MGVATDISWDLLPRAQEMVNVDYLPLRIWAANLLNPFLGGVVRLICTHTHISKHFVHTKYYINLKYFLWINSSDLHFGQASQAYRYINPFFIFSVEPQLFKHYIQRISSNKITRKRTPVSTSHCIWSEQKRDGVLTFISLWIKHSITASPKRWY